ncbi:MAG: tagaturonate reductase, partial [Bacteroidota bacterium]
MSHVTESLNRESKSHTLSRPIKVIQFGEGNFLRAFVDWIIQELNDQTAFNGSVKVIQPIPRGYGDKINEQDGLYHVVLKGYEGEHFRSTTHLIDVIEEAINPYQQFETFLKEAENPELEYIISNTTEAGITLNENDKITDEPASSYPGKLLQFLHHRYRTLPNSKPVYLLPCELIDQNASKLKEIIYLLSAKWKLGNYFNTWLGEKIFFC